MNNSRYNYIDLLTKATPATCRLNVPRCPFRQLRDYTVALPSSLNVKGHGVTIVSIECKSFGFRFLTIGSQNYIARTETVRGSWKSRETRLRGFLKENWKVKNKRRRRRRLWLVCIEEHSEDPRTFRRLSMIKFYCRIIRRGKSNGGKTPVEQILQGETKTVGIGGFSNSISRQDKRIRNRSSGSSQCKKRPIWHSRPPRRYRWTRKREEKG